MIVVEESEAHWRVCVAIGWITKEIELWNVREGEVRGPRRPRKVETRKEIRYDDMGALFCRFGKRMTLTNGGELGEVDDRGRSRPGSEG